jgi:hypothetical protein
LCGGSLLKTGGFGNVVCVLLRANVPLAENLVRVALRDYFRAQTPISASHIGTQIPRRRHTNSVALPQYKLKNYAKYCEFLHQPVAHSVKRYNKHHNVDSGNGTSSKDLANDFT